MVHWVFAVGDLRVRGSASTTGRRWASKETGAKAALPMWMDFMRR
jgi:hypothetical protein